MRVGKGFQTKAVFPSEILIQIQHQIFTVNSVFETLVKNLPLPLFGIGSDPGVGNKKLERVVHN